MTEQEWLEWSAYPGGVAEMFRGKVGPRKARLFAVACCRRIAHLLPEDRRLRQGLEVAERYADRLATRQELVRAHAAAEAAGCRAARSAYTTCAGTAAAKAAEAVTLAAHPTSRSNLAGVVCSAGDAVSYAALPPDAPAGSAHRPGTRDPWFAAKGAEYAAQCTLLRDVYGNPFRPPPSVSRSVLAWNGGTVPKVARAVYEEHAFDRLAVLADALEDAGCANADLLSHCRSPGPHARGCWVLDVILGKG